MCEFAVIAVYLMIKFRVEEYIASGRDRIIVDPDPNKIYTKRKARESSVSFPDASSQSKAATEVKYPSNGWGKSLEKMPLYLGIVLMVRF